MGAGNPLLRSFDPELYQAKTFFIDFVDNVTDEELEEYVNANEDVPFHNWTEEEKQSLRYSIAGWNTSDFKENYFDGYNIPDEKDRCINELSAEFRGCGYILAETETGLIVSTSDSDIDHYAIGIVPKFKYEDLYDEIYQDHEKKIYWYEKRGLSFDENIERLTITKYKRMVKKFKAENEPIMQKLYSDYGSCMSERSGAWTSQSIKEIKSNFKFL